jgi:hypothetical protein
VHVIRTFLAQESKPRIQAENFWFSARPHWAAIREHALAGKKHKETAALVGRSPASVSGCVRRMIRIGLIDPVPLARARWRPSTATRLIDARQLDLWGQLAA